MSFWAAETGLQGNYKYKQGQRPPCHAFPDILDSVQIPFGRAAPRPKASLHASLLVCSLSLYSTSNPQLAVPSYRPTRASVLSSHYRQCLVESLKTSIVPPCRCHYMLRLAALQAVSRYPAASLLPTGPTVSRRIYEEYTPSQAA